MILYLTIYNPRTASLQKLFYKSVEGMLTLLNVANAQNIDLLDVQVILSPEKSVLCGPCFPWLGYLNPQGLSVNSQPRGFGDELLDRNTSILLEVTVHSLLVIRGWADWLCGAAMCRLSYPN